MKSYLRPAPHSEIRVGLVGDRQIFLHKVLSWPEWRGNSRLALIQIRLVTPVCKKSLLLVKPIR